MLPQLAPVVSSSGVTRDGPVLAVTWPTNGHRPGYAGKEDPAGAPAFLDFVKMPSVLKDLDEDAFRKAIVDTLLPCQDLGLNRSKGAERVEAYLDMVTWDARFRADWANDNSLNSSSCGMFVRNVYWLAGARGHALFDTAYKSGVLTSLVNMDADACKRWGSGFNAKTFFPKIGDALYLYDSATNSQHIFIIAAIDKKIVDEGGVATVYNDDGSKAGEITFTSVDGGQSDGTGPDGKGASKAWGCQGVHKVYRKLTLKDGLFPNIGVSWPRARPNPPPPPHTWISIWEAREKFTAPWLKPMRLGAIGEAGSVGAPIKRVEPLDDSAAPVKFETWPTYTSPVPKSILDKVKTNREAIPVMDFVTFKVDGSPAGYSYPAKGKDPKPVICTAEEAADTKLKAVLERLQVEMSGEGGVSAILTGDAAQFTWGRGLAHKGALEASFFEFISTNAAAKKAFFDCGITLEANSWSAWKVVDLESNTVQTGAAAIGLLNGAQPAEAKKALLSVFIKITEDHLASASKAQWDVFKKNFFYGPPVPRVAIDTWEPEAVCYVVHCQAWGKFAGWGLFEKTGGDLKKILRLEVDYTNYGEEKPTYLLVPPVKGKVMPSLTMLNNMGHKCMLSILEPCPDASGLPKTQQGDVVFQMNAGHSPLYYILRGTPRMFDPNNKYDVWVEENHDRAMADLLARLDKLGKKEVVATRDRYVAANNPAKGKWGLRPQIAMEAVIHKNEGLPAIWVLDQLQFIGVSLASHPDQYLAVSKMVGLEKYDAWVEKNHALPMDYLLKEIGKLGYKETQATRDWYAHAKNQKKEKWGARPRIALDAVLHKNEGPTAGWILNECEWAGLGPATTPDQYDLIKRTIGA